VHEQQGTKSPEKNLGHMNFGDMIPEMFLQEMIWYCGHNEEGSERDNKQGTAEDTAGWRTVAPLCSELPLGKAATGVFCMESKFMTTVFFL